jgi:hypothetical protein
MFDDEGTPGQPWRPAKERAPPLMDHAPGGKPSAFSWPMGRLILARIEAGETVRQITADPGMPCYATVYRWTHVVPEFGRAWRALRVEMAETQRWLDDQRAVARTWMRAHERRLAGKPPRAGVSGRKSSYTPEWGEAVCRAIVEGASLSEVVARPDMPSFRAVYRWMRRFPEFRAAYAEACRWREEMLADQALEAALSATPKTIAAARRRKARVEGRMGRLRPRKYKSG